jgi:hypothetical protein
VRFKQTEQAPETCAMQSIDGLQELEHRLPHLRERHCLEFPHQLIQAPADRRELGLAQVAMTVAG